MGYGPPITTNSASIIILTESFIILVNLDYS